MVAEGERALYLFAEAHLRLAAESMATSQNSEVKRWHWLTRDKQQNVARNAYQW